MSDRRMTDDRPTGSDVDARFDAELARAARALVTEDLPRGVLDAGLSAEGGGAGAVRARRPMPAFAGIAATLVLLVVGAIALTPGGGPPASPTPPAGSTRPSAAPSPSPGATVMLPGSFRSTAEIRADFATLRYACQPGNELLPTGPSPSAMVMEGVICLSPADDGPYTAAVIVGEARDGRVVEIHVKADLTGVDNAAAREAIAVPMAKAAAIAAPGDGTGDALAAWVLQAAPLLTLNDSDSTKLGGFVLKVARASNGTYQLFMVEVPSPS